MNEAVFNLQQLALELIAAKRPTDEILNRLCELVQEIVPNGLATVMRFDAKRNKLTFRNAPSAPACVLQSFGELTPGPLSGSCGTSVYEGKLVAVSDTSTDPRWESLRSVAEEYNIRSCWSVPIFIDKEQIAGTFAISRTVTGMPSDEERRLLEMAAHTAGIVLRLELAEQRERDQATLLRSIVDCAEDPIFVKDKQGKYQLINQAFARERGVAKEDIIGMTDEQIFGEAASGPRHEADQRVLTTGESVVHEVESPSITGGGMCDYIVRRDPLRDANGEISGIVGIAHDVTESRRVERAMLQTQKLESLGVLASGIAHDFNNLLVGVVANASMLEIRPELPSDMQTNVADIRLAAERATDLTRQLMQYAGRREPERTAVSADDLLTEMPTLLASSISKKVALQTHIEESLPPISADPVQVRQVLMNLILNASEAFDGDDGTIEINAKLHKDITPRARFVTQEAGKRGNWIEISVTDDGPGMDQQTIAKIFDPFFTTKATGRGLGLAAVLGIVASHDGYLDVESRLGTGTTFRMWLPIATACATDKPTLIPQAQPRAPVTTEKKCVLIIEDEPVITTVLKRILAHNGFDSCTADNGQAGIEAFEQAGKGKFAAVIADYTMPGLDGTEVAHRIRSQAPNTPIVLTSGLGKDNNLDSDAVDAFLSKPFTPDQVMRALTEAINRREAAPA